jgi:type II secretory pathway component GspD/PulD (secretin)
MRYSRLGITGGALLTMLATGTVRAETGTAADPLATLSTKRVSLQFRQVPARDLFNILGDAAQKQFRLDACIADRKVDVKFQNAPLRMVVDAIGLQLSLTYRDGGSWIDVTCQ